MFCTRQKEEPYNVCANAAKTKPNQTENEKHSCARSENEPLWEFNVRKGRSRERSNTLSRLRFWTQPAGLNVGCDESDVSSFFFSKKKQHKKKKRTQQQLQQSEHTGTENGGRSAADAFEWLIPLWADDDATPSKKYVWKMVTGGGGVSCSFFWKF